MSLHAGAPSHASQPADERRAGRLARARCSDLHRRSPLPTSLPTLRTSRHLSQVPRARDPARLDQVLFRRRHVVDGLHPRRDAAGEADVPWLLYHQPDREDCRAGWPSQRGGHQGDVRPEPSPALQSWHPLATCSPPACPPLATRLPSPGHPPALPWPPLAILAPSSRALAPAALRSSAFAPTMMQSLSSNSKTGEVSGTSESDIAQRWRAKLPNASDDAVSLRADEATRRDRLGSGGVERARCGKR